MAGWIRTMLSTPDEPLTPLARYTQANGALYIAMGLVTWVYPGGAQLVGVPSFVGQEEGLVRAIGAALAVVGWFYVFGARTNRDSFGLATVGDRIVVPFLFGSIVIWGGSNENEFALTWYNASMTNRDLYLADYIKLYLDTMRPALAAADPDGRAFVDSSPSNELVSTVPYGT